MRTAIRVAFLGLVMAAVVGVPATAAHGRRTPPSQRVDVRASAGRAVQGGTLLVAVKVQYPRRLARTGVTPVASAVVHFASGDVSVELTGFGRGALAGHRFGHRAWWSSVRVWRGFARVPVGADEPVGRVAVDVTVTVGDGSVTVTTFGRIHAARGGEEPPPDPDPEVPCAEGCQEL